tara:strand:+ start:694 stop:1089 length:396 start_codon:yes stop_codon:yes gene_type:complete
MDPKAMIESIAQTRNWALTIPEDNVYLLGMPTTDGRSQQVYVIFREEEGHQAAILWSVVGSASKFEDPWELLDYNWSHTYGSLARRGNSIVLKNSELVTEGDEDHLILAIEHVGTTADSIERELYGELDLN